MPYSNKKTGKSKHEQIMDYCNGRYSIRDVYNQIIDKKCSLPRSLRDYVLSFFDENGNFIIKKY